MNGDVPVSVDISINRKSVFCDTKTTFNLSFTIMLRIRSMFHSSIQSFVYAFLRYCVACFLRFGMNRMIFIALIVHIMKSLPLFTCILISIFDWCLNFNFSSLFICPPLLKIFDNLCNCIFSVVIFLYH